MKREEDRAGSAWSWCLGLSVTWPCWFFAAIACYISLFSGVLSHSFVAYDDVDYVVRNVNIRRGLSFDGIEWAFGSLNAGTSYWHPLTWISHQFDWALFGEHYGWHKLTSVLLHLYCSLLLLGMLRRLCHPWPVCVGVAILFACHPLHIESVVWISERKDVLCAFFSFLAFHSYLDFRETRNGANYARLCFWFSCALMSKPMAVSLPMILLLIDFWMVRLDELRGGKEGVAVMRLIREKVPLFCLSLVVGVITLRAQSQLGIVPNLEELSLAPRIANALESYLIYVQKTLLPFDLAIGYPYPETFSPWRVIAAIVFFVGMSAWSIRSWRSNLIVPFCWGWYVITLLPVIGLIQTSEQARADRYAYLALLGILLLLVSALYRCWSRDYRWLANGAMILGVLVSLVVSWRQIGYWKNSETLFRRAIQVSERNAMMHVALANSLDWERSGQEALSHLKTAMEISSDCFEAYEALAQYHRFVGESELEHVCLRKALYWGATSPWLKVRLRSIEGK